MTPKRWLYLLCAVWVLAVGALAALETPEPGESVSLPELSGVEGGSAVCLNTADAEELMALPGIGPVMAARIVDYRERHRGFDSLEELIRVEGIGEARLRAWSRHMVLGEWEESS